MTFEAIAEAFPFAAFRDTERGQVEQALRRCVDAYGHCADGYDGDDEELMDDMLDIIKPSEDDEILYLRVMDAMLDIVLN